MSGVRTWPTYLLRDIPPHIRAAIEVDADLDGRGLVEVVREILCAHYDLDCDAVFTSSSKLNQYIPGTTTMLLRLQPELWEAIKADVGPTRSATHNKIHAILAAHYNGGHPHD